MNNSCALDRRDRNVCSIYGSLYSECQIIVCDFILLFLFRKVSLLKPKSIQHDLYLCLVHSYRKFSSHPLAFVPRFCGSPVNGTSSVTDNFETPSDLSPSFQIPLISFFYFILGTLVEDVSHLSSLSSLGGSTSVLPS